MMLNRKRLAYLIPLLLATQVFGATTKPAPKPAPKPTATQPAIADVVRAKRFELVDDKGEVRAVIGLTSDNATIIKLLDKDGKTALALRSDQGLGILNEEGKRKLVVGSAGAGYGIGVYDSKGEPRAQITLVDDEPWMTMSDSGGKFRYTMCLVDDQPVLNLSDGKDSGASIRLKLNGQSPSLLLTDSSGKARSEHSLASDGYPRLLMTNASGASCLQLLFDNDLPYIETMYPNGMPAAMMGIVGGSGFFRTSDTSNNTVWQNP